MIAKYLIYVPLLFMFLAGPSVAEPLKAHIRHSEEVNPVTPQLRAGSQFNQADLPKKDANSKWFQIPKWMAGEWRRKKVFVRKNGRLVLGQQDIRQHRYGYQTDAEGRVWHWVRAPHTVITEQPETVSYFLIKNEDLIHANDDMATIKIYWTTWVIDKNTRVIKKVIQGIQVDTYRPSGEGVILAESHVANYNQDGKLITKQIWCWKDELMVYYEPVPFQEGVNVKQIFKNFLNSKQLGALVPPG